eukprot:3968264-Prymnesium_polylepis.1
MTSLLTAAADIVFFGEQLPERFFSLASSDFPDCDLLIVMGTSLKVQPFASLTSRVAPNVPRLLINREQARTPLREPRRRYQKAHGGRNQKRPRAAPLQPRQQPCVQIPNP